MRWIAKLLGLLVVLVGLGVLALMAGALMSGQPVAQPLGQIWYGVDAGSLNLLQALIERGLWPPLWDWVVFPVLRQPAPWVAIGALVVGTLLLLGGRRRGNGNGNGLLKRKRMFSK